MHSIRRTAGDVLEVKLSGSVTTDDYEAVIPAIESSIEDQREVRLLYDMSEVDAIEPSTIWADVVFDLRYRTDVQRIAIVADGRWRRSAMRLFLVPKPRSVRAFDTGRLDVAGDWVREFGTPDKVFVSRRWRRS